jgi:hypothetical protein
LSSPSYTSPFAFIEMASDGHPLVTGVQFREITDRYGWNMRRRRRSESKDCPCWDPKAKWANPDCPFCEGTGSLTVYQDIIIKGIVLFNLPNGYWALGNIYTKAGVMERVEAAGFYPEGTDVRMGDLILFTTSSATATTEVYEEFEVVSIMPRIIGQGTGYYAHIFTAVGMRKTSHDIAKAFPP